MDGWWQAFVQRLRNRLSIDELDTELNEEMEDHLARKQAEMQEVHGLSPSDAYHRALREFGNRTLFREKARSEWIWPTLESVAMDLRFAARTLRKNWGFSSAVVFCIALNAGFNLSVYSVFDRLFFRTLPVPDSAALVALSHRAEVGGINESMSYPDYLDYNQRVNSLQKLAAFMEFEAPVSFEEGITSLHGELVTGNYFDTLGIQPRLGRWFTAEEGRDWALSRVAVLGEDYWSNVLNKDAGVIGRKIFIRGQSLTIIGIAPKSYCGIRLDSGAAKIWLPFPAYRITNPELLGGPSLEGNRGNHSVQVFGRLRRGVALQAAQTEVLALSHRLRQTVWQQQKAAWAQLWRQGPPTWSALLSPLDQARINPDARSALSTFLSALTATVICFLLFACCNLGLKYAARALRLRREIALRLALGISQARLFRQWLCESTLLALLGTLLGLGLSAGLTSILGAMYAPFRAVTEGRSAIDTRTAVAALALAPTLAIALSLLPARLALSIDLASAIKSARRLGFTPGRLDLRRMFVAGQVAISAILLVGATLFVQTLRNAITADVTRDADQVLMTQLQLEQAHADEQQGLRLFEELIQRLESQPGIRSAALVLVVPLGGRRGGANVEVPQPGQPKALQVDLNVVTSKYFDTIGLPLLAGRPFRETDRNGAPRVAIVNEEWVRRLDDSILPKTRLANALRSRASRTRSSA